MSKNRKKGKPGKVLNTGGNLVPIPNFPKIRPDALYGYSPIWFVRHPFDEEINLGVLVIDSENLPMAFRPVDQSPGRGITASIFSEATDISKRPVFASRYPGWVDLRGAGRTETSPAFPAYLIDAAIVPAFYDPTHEDEQTRPMNWRTERRLTVIYTPVDARRDHDALIRTFDGLFAPDVLRERPYRILQVESADGESCQHFAYYGGPPVDFLQDDKPAHRPRRPKPPGQGTGGAASAN